MSNLGAALHAQQMGWYIFPCEPGEKQGAKPFPGAPFRIKWYDEATNDIGQIIKWWELNPFYNVGISCKKSGLLVVDCDMPKNWGSAREDGVDQYRRICASHMDWHELTDTYRVETPSYGMHYYYRWPAEIKASQASLDSLLDVRTNGGTKGGYVLGQGSSTKDGLYVIDNSATVMSAPGWLVSLVMEKPRTRPSARIRQPGRSNFAGLVLKLATAEQGNRNNLLYWEARTLCEEGVPQEEAEDLLSDAGTTCGLHERDIRATVRSGYRAQQWSIEHRG